NTGRTAVRASRLARTKSRRAPQHEQLGRSSNAIAPPRGRSPPALSRARTCVIVTHNQGRPVRRGAQGALIGPQSLFLPRPTPRFAIKRGRFGGPPDASAWRYLWAQ